MDSLSLFHDSRTIAIVGLSDKPDRPSYQVAEYLLQQGYQVIPVNPMIERVFDIPTYPTISSIPLSQHIDVVDIFRKSEEVLHIVEEVIQTGRKPIIWMQEGISSPEAEKLAKANDLEVVANMCMMKTHKAL